MPIEECSIVLLVIISDCSHGMQHTRVYAFSSQELQFDIGDPSANCDHFFIMGSIGESFIIRSRLLISDISQINSRPVNPLGTYGSGRIHIVFHVFRNYQRDRVEVLQNKYVYHVQVDCFRSRNWGLILVAQF